MSKKKKQQPADDGHFTDDPLDVINAKPDFSDMGFRTLSDEEIEKMAREMYEKTKEWMRRNVWKGMFPSED